MVIKLVQQVFLRPLPPVLADDWRERFGFLPQPVELNFRGGSVSPLGNYAEVRAWVDGRSGG